MDPSNELTALKVNGKKEFVYQPRFMVKKTKQYTNICSYMPKIGCG